MHASNVPSTMILIHVDKVWFPLISYHEQHVQTIINAFSSGSLWLELDKDTIRRPCAPMMAHGHLSKVKEWKNFLWILIILCKINNNEWVLKTIDEFFLVVPCKSQTRRHPRHAPWIGFVHWKWMSWFKHVLEGKKGP